MRHIIPIITLFLLQILSSSSLRAGEIEVKFDKLKQLPATVQLQTASGFKTLDLGSSKIGPNGSNVLFHLYTLPNRKPQHSYLDLFIREKNKFSRVNHLMLAGVVEGSISPRYFNATPITWLDRKRLRMPIVPVTTKSRSELDSGDCWLFVFVDGIGKAPTVQKFEWYSGLQADLTVHFEDTDEDGFTDVNNYYSRTGGGPDYVEQQNRLFRWDGRRFIERKPTHHH